MIRRIRPFIYLLLHPSSRPLTSCIEGSSCVGQRRHGLCVHCGATTCRRTGYIDDEGRRRVGPVCGPAIMTRNRWLDTQRQRAQARRLNDLERVTVPPEDGHVDYGEMPDQYAGPTRDAVRAMLDSDAEEAVVKGIAAVTLNQSLSATGLDSKLYAETRDGETVLRRISE